MRLNHWLSGLFPRYRFLNPVGRRRLRKRRVAHGQIGHSCGITSFVDQLETRQLLSATQIAVTTFSDVVNAGDGQTSLREAVIQANSTTGDVEILLQAGTYQLGIAGAGEDLAATGDLDIRNTTGNIKVIGAGSNLTTIDADQLERVFEVKSSASLTIDGVKLVGGQTASAESTLQVSNAGSLKLSNTVVSEASSANQAAIAIQSGGNLDLTSANNTINAVGSGQLLSWQATAGLNIAGNTFQVNGTSLNTGVLADNFAIEDRITHALDNAAYGRVTWVNNNTVYVTTNTLGIQRGVNVAANGNTVYVNDGTYTGNVSLAARNLKLLSANGRDATTIQGNGAGTELGTIYITNGSNVQIGDVGHGFTINGIDSASAGLEKAAIYYNQTVFTGSKIYDNEIVAAGEYGLLAAFGATLSNFEIVGNTFSGQTFTGTYANGIGFVGQFTTPNTPRQLVVLGNGGGNNATANARNITFSNNVITGVAGGFNIDNTTEQQGNTLVTIDAANSTISNNTFAGYTTRFGAALRVRRPDTVISGNVFNSDNMTASTVQLYAGNAASGGLTVTNNSFNTGKNVALEVESGGATINASGNWWGTATPGNVTAYLRGSVDFSPMLASGTDTSANAGFQGDLDHVIVHNLGQQTGSLARIQEGLNLVNANGILQIAEGTYVHTGQMDVNKTVTFQGAGKDATVIKNSGQATGTEVRTIQVNAANVTFQDLTFGGWVQAPSNANVGNGYLVWLNTPADGATFDNVRFDGNDIRVALYMGQRNNLTITDSTFTGTYFRAGIRGAGENMLISGNTFNESHYWYSPIYFEYGAPTSGEISYNYFANRVGVNNQVYGNFHSDGTGLYAITNFQPNKVTSDGLLIAHNTFHFQDSNLVNSEGKSPNPVAIYNDPALAATGPITIRDNIFQGYQYTGVQPNSGPDWRPSARGNPYNGALNFDGSLTVGAFQSPLVDIGSKGTISFWINPTDVGSQRRALFNGGGVEVTLRNGTIYFYPDSGETSSLTYAVNNLLSANTWTHVAVSWDYATQTTAIYVNGQEATYQAGDTPADATWVTPADTTNKPIYVGYDPANADRDYPGQMDDIGIFSDKLSQSEIAALMNNGVSTFTGDSRMVAGWTLDQTSGNVATGLKNGIDLQIGTSGYSPLAAAAFQPGGGHFGGGLQFNAAQQNFGTFQSPSYNVGASGSLSLWINPTDVGSQRHQILDGGGMGFTIRNSNVYFYTVSGQDATLTYTNNNAITANTWHHVVFTWDFTTKTTHIYINGTEATYQPAFSTSHPGWTSPANTVDQLMTLGFDFANPDRGFGGRMDDVGIFREAVSASDVASLYNNGVSAFAADSRLVTHWAFDNAPGTVTVPSDHGAPITLYLQQRPTLPPVQGMAINSSPGTTVSNNLFYQNDADYNVSVTDTGDNLNGPPVFNLGLYDPNANPYQIGFGSLAAYASTEFKIDSGTDSPHIGAYQGSPGLFGTGDLVVNGSDGDDLLVLTITGANSGTLTYTRDLGGANEVVGAPTPVVLTSITGLTFNGGLGDDRLIINNPSGSVFAPINGIHFNGGSGGEDGVPTGNPLGDTLAIFGGEANTVEHRFITADSGSILFDGALAYTYTGLEPTIVDTVAAQQRDFTFTGASETITLSNDTGAAGRSQIESTLGNLVSFVTPSSEVNINTEASGGTGTDIVNINSVDAAFAADLTVNGGIDDDVKFTGALSLSGNLYVANARDIAVETGATATTTGTGTIELNAFRNINVNGTGVISSDSGTTSLTADTAVGNLGGTISLSAAAQITSVSGDISLLADGNVSLTGVNTTGQVTATSTSGSLTDAGNLRSDIIASKALLKAAVAVSGLDTQVSNLEGSAGSGGFTLGNSGNLTLGGVSSDVTGVSTANGLIYIQASSGNLTVSEAVNSGGGSLLLVGSSGDVNVDATVDSGSNGLINLTTTTSGDVNVNAVVKSVTGQIAVNSAGDASFTANGSIQNNGNATIQAANDIEMADGSFVQAGSGAIAVSAGADFKISSLQTSASVIAIAGGSIIDNGDTDPDVIAAISYLQAGNDIGGLNALDTQLTKLELSAGGKANISNTGDLNVGGVIPHHGILVGTSLDLQNNGAVTISEQVKSNSGNLNISANGGQTLTVASTGSVVAGNNANLTAARDLTLQNGSSVSAVNQVNLAGGADNSGATISLLGTVQSGVRGTVTGGTGDDLIIVNPGTGNTVNSMLLDGAIGADEYRVFLGRLAGSIDIEDSGVSGTDTATVFGTDQNDVFILNNKVTNGVSPQTGGTISLTNIASQNVTYSTSLEILTARGEGGTDLFHVQPSQSTILTIDGNFPGFGQPNAPGGTPAGDGDVIDLDSFGNTFQIVGNAIQVNGGSPAAFQRINFRRIEGLPLTPIGDSVWRFDFNASGEITQGGYTGVARTQVYGNAAIPGTDYGWVTAPTTAFDRGVIGGSLESLLRDGHLDSVTRTFRADVTNGWYLVSVKIGDQQSPHDRIQITNADDGQILASDIATQAGEYVTRTFAVQAKNGSLAFNISDLGGGNPHWVLNALEIRPAELLTLGIADTGPFTADGVTEHEFEIFNVTPGATVTVTAGLDSTGDGIPDLPVQVLNTDASSQITGVQIGPDVNGRYFVKLRSPAGKGTVYLQFEEVSGDRTGLASIDFNAPDIRRFDFNSGVSPTQTPVAANAPNSSGYTGVLPTTLYGTGTGYGWLTSTVGFDRGDLNPNEVQEDLRRDGNMGTAARTFRTELAAGTYWVNVTMGDFQTARDQMLVYANGSSTPSLSGIETPAGQFYTGGFLVTVGDDGILDLTFADAGGSTPQWVINGLEIRRQTAATNITFAVTGDPQVPADGTTTRVITGSAAGLTDGTLVTVSTSLGTIVGSDAGTQFVGHQVVVSGGQFSFTIKAPTGAGDPTITAKAVDGSAFGSANGVLTFVFNQTAQSWLYDFNTPTSATQAGYTGVLTTNLYTSAVGYGWVSTSPTAFTRSIASTPYTNLLQDGHLGGAGTAGRRTFRVDLQANTTYTITVTMGDGQSARDFMEIRNGKTGALFAANTENINTDAGQFTTVTFQATTDATGDLQLQFGDTGGNANWVVNALAIYNMPTAVSVTSPSNTALAADATTVDTFTVNGLTAGMLYTISASNGTITAFNGVAVSDSNSLYAGNQFLATGSSMTVGVRRPSGPGSVTLTVAEVAGSAVGSATQVYAANSVQRYDFNGAASDTATGFIGVGKNDLFSASKGYGWVTAVTDFQRTTASQTPALYRDGAMGGAGAAGERTFRIAVTPGGTYDVRVYTGDATTARDQLQVTAEGIVASPVNTNVDQYVTVLLQGVVDSDNDGILNITFRDLGGNANWVVNGVEIAEVSAQQTFAGSAGAGAAAISQVNLQSALNSAIQRMVAAGYSASLFSNVQVQSTDFGSKGTLSALGGNVILVDDNAFGYGWYVDATPLTDSEFDNVISAKARQVTNSGDPAFGKVDLLTVLMHQLGRIAGNATISPLVDPNDLMTTTLGTGVRRLP